MWNGDDLVADHGIPDDLLGDMLSFTLLFANLAGLATRHALLRGAVPEGTAPIPAPRDTDERFGSHSHGEACGQ